MLSRGIVITQRFIIMPNIDSTTFPSLIHYRLMEYAILFNAVMPTYDSMKYFE